MFFINPFIYGGAAGDFESIATVTVGSGGVTDLEFTSIPSTYQHLQVRAIARDSGAVSLSTLFINFNGVTTGNQYAEHRLSGNGTDAQATASASANRITCGRLTGASATANIFSAFVIDILDYASTTKATTMRSYAGQDTNGGGEIHLRSGLWTATSAITSMKFTVASSGLAQHSAFSLYGIKAP